MAKRLTENHPLQKKVRQLEQYMEELGLSIEFDGYHLLISDRETSCIYKEADTGEYATEFPLMTESKLVMED